jgi:hypothetical protein
MSFPNAFINVLVGWCVLCYSFTELQYSCKLKSLDACVNLSLILFYFYFNYRAVVAPVCVSYICIVQKNAFEWGLSMIPHSEDAVQVTQHVANFLVRLVLKT